jgi:hypothetical protein
MDLIWAKQEGIYFCKWGWTGDLPARQTAQMNNAICGASWFETAQARLLTTRACTMRSCCLSKLTNLILRAASFAASRRMRAPRGRLSPDVASVIRLNLCGGRKKKTPGRQAGRKSRRAIVSVAKQWLHCGEAGPDRLSTSEHWTATKQLCVAPVLPGVRLREARPVDSLGHHPPSKQEKKCSPDERNGIGET